MTTKIKKTLIELSIICSVFFQTFSFAADNPLAQIVAVTEPLQTGTKVPSPSSSSAASDETPAQPTKGPQTDQPKTETGSPKKTDTSTPKETVEIKAMFTCDNAYVQRYKNHLGRWVIVRRGDTVNRIAGRYGASVRKIILLNGLGRRALIRVGDYVFVPYPKDQIKKLTKIKKIVLEGKDFIVPVEGYVTSHYGMRNWYSRGRQYSRFHKGIDLGAPSGTIILASKGGIVKYTGWYQNYGNIVWLEHGNGVETLYAHCLKTVVKAGQKVERGQMIGMVGNTGRSTGPHLHFEVRLAGQAVDPANHLDFSQYTYAAYKERKKDAVSAGVGGSE